MKPSKNRRVLARFCPVTKDDLDQELVELVGTKAEFCYHKMINDDDTPYFGWVLTTEDKRFGGYWFPESDLEILQEMNSV